MIWLIAVGVLMYAAWGYVAFVSFMVSHNLSPARALGLAMVWPIGIGYAKKKAPA